MRAIEIQPDWSDPHLLFAEIYRRQGDREEAARSLQAAVSNHPSRLSIRRQLADLLVSLDRYDSAIAHYNIWLMNNQTMPCCMSEWVMPILGQAPLKEPLDGPKQPKSSSPSLDVLELKVQSLIVMGHIDEALSIHSPLYQDPIEGLRHRLSIAKALAARGFEGRAEAEFTEAVQRYPSDMSSWLSYAEWYASRGLNERAEALLRKGLNRLPDAAALHHAISSIFEAQGYREIALKALKKAVSLAPDRVDFGDELARLEFFSGFAEAAIERWETLLVRAPKNQEVTRNLALAYQALGQFEKSIPLMEALRRERPQDVELLKILGEMYMDAGRFEDAVGTLRAVSLADNSNFEAENLLAQALVKEGH